MWEMKRVFSRKLLSIIGLAILLNAGMFLYGQTNGNSFSYTVHTSTEYRNLIDNYAGMDYADASDDIGNRIKAIKKGEAEGDITVYQKMKQKLDYLSGYRASIDNIFENAAKLSTISVFSKPDTYSYSNIMKTENDFQGIRNTNVALDNDVAVDNVTGYNITFYIAFAIMILMIYALQDERDNGVWQLVHTSSKGRMRMAVNRLVIITAGSFVVTMLLYLSTVVTAFGIYGGINSLKDPIQTISKFSLFCYPLNKAEYLVVNLVLSWFVIWSLCIVVWLIFTKIRSRNYAVALIMAIVGAEVLIYQAVSEHSVYRYFKYINIINLFDISDMFGTYRNWGKGTVVLSVIWTVVAAMAVVLIICASAAVLIYASIRPFGKKSRTTFFGDYASKFYQKVLSTVPMTIKELHKLILSGKNIWIIAGLLILSIYFVSSGKMQFNDLYKEDDALYLEQGGMNYSQLKDMVEQRYDALEETKAALADAQEKYNSGEMPVHDYMQYATAYTNAKDDTAVVSEFKNKLDYLGSIQQNYGVNGYMMSDRGYEEIFGQYSIRRETILSILLITVIILIVSESISFEYVSGMSAIVRSTSKGKKWLFIRKVMAVYSFTFLMFLLIYGIDLFYMYRYYGMPYLTAPVMSLTFMEGFKLHITVIQWIVLIYTLKLVYLFSIAGIIMLISVLLGKKSSRFVILLVIAGMIAVNLMMQKMEVTSEIILSVVLLLIGAIAVFMAQKIWVGEFRKR